MQGFIYDNGVHIELFMQSLDKFKTDSKNINYNDLENEKYFIANKKSASKIPIYACNDNDLFSLQVNANAEIPSVIIITQNVKDEYSKCQYVELIKKDISLTFERGVYKFTSGGKSYKLREIKNSKLDEIYKKELDSNKVYVSLDTGFSEYVNIDGEGWMWKNEAYRIDRNIDNKEQNVSSKSFTRSIYILKDKLTLTDNTKSWYVFNKDLLNCGTEPFFNVIVTNSRYKMLVCKEKPAQQYKEDMKKWIINPIDNPFPEDTRIKFSETVRTGTRRDDIVRIKHDGAYYFFRNKDVTRMYLKNNIEEQKEALLQYHILGLPFFNLLKDTNTNLKCDVVKLNEKVKPIAESSGVKDRANYKNSETFAEGIYKEEKLYKTLNTLIIHCPSFWEEKKNIRPPDYGLQTNLNKYKEYIKERLWMSGAVKRHMKVGNTRTFYYFHPINFMRYVCGELVMEFNPYLGEHRDVDSKSFNCISNPGRG